MTEKPDLRWNEANNVNETMWLRWFLDGLPAELTR